MFNRGFVAEPVESHALQARRAVAECFTRRLRDLPAAPLNFAALESWAPLPGGAELRALHRTAFDGAGRQKQLDVIWRDSLATAFCASRVARQLGAQVSVSAAAGLLHRIGDALTLSAVIRSETDAGVVLDAPSRATLVNQHAGETAERVLRWWCIPASVAATALGWRRFGEFPAGPKNCAAVYLAHLLTIEWLEPRLCAPGIVESVAGELGLDAAAVAACRPDTGVQARLAKLPGIAIH
ncbi:MAG TPA: HDOD domain-containing protein [Steroidobacteraceae bacterium]|nr:HDOD domain-containing protein [Steroidobacteraceae bacterium]HRX89751.1 HDOD domain-containing protein [Steroidobacteraceae bacterium]